MNKTIYRQTLLDITHAWYINASIPKGYGTRSSDYDRKYKIKDYFIKKIIGNIRQHQLPIKYGVRYGVVYFAFCGVQISFHFSIKEIEIENGKVLWKTTYECKPYHGRWQGTKIGGEKYFYTDAKLKFYKKLKRIARGR